ncbi:hypothetical protein ykris0001_39590 [Yersinia kristensenii ATCC 33638]|nr:hypothetical protein ykris0001_39590 [Yersinia kristensenii ATCC 33638]
MKVIFINTSRIRTIEETRKAALIAAGAGQGAILKSYLL